MNPNPPDQLDPPPPDPSGADRLPCGRDPLEVWDHAAGTRLTSHEQTCRYCQGVIAEHDILAEPTNAWRSRKVDPPTALLERVMAIVRSNLRARNYLPLASPYGPVQLDTATAAAVMRWAVDQVDGARARSCKIDARLPVATDAPPADEPPTVDVRLTMTGLTGSRLQALADQIRELLVAVGRELLGVHVATIDIEIVDLFDAEPPDGEGR